MKTFIISGTIGWNVDAAALRKFLKQAAGEEVAFIINSPGGSVIDGFEMYNELRAYPGKLNIVMNSFTASIASYLSTVPNAIRYSMENTVWMHHNAWGLAIGDYRVMAQFGGILDSMTGIIADAYVRVTKRDRATIRQQMDAETWLFGNEIIENGFSDKMLNSFSDLNLEISDSEKNQLTYEWDKAKSKNEMLNNAKMRYEMAKREANTKDANAYIDVNRVAALGLIPAAAPENKGGSKPMAKTLKEILAEDKTLQTEFDAMLAESVKVQSEAAIKAQRENALAILDISGLTVTETVRAAIANGMDVKDYSVQELKAKAAKRAAAPPQNFGALTDNTVPGKGAPKDEKSERQKADLDGWDALYGKGVK